MSTSLATLAVKAYSFLLPVSWLALAVAVVILLPMALVARWRAMAGGGLMVASFIFGATTWMLGAFVTFAVYGFGGFVVGVLFFGVGVVPIAIFAALFKVHSLNMAASLVVMLAVTYTARLGGGQLAVAAARDS